ncbi:MAG: glycosyltransferase family 2 protein [Candidatus Hydrogenedentes bacterium]|nr:glycosyltransferase family 2 protein [Candidatus Hydrogenedentota bacterium]
MTQGTLDLALPEISVLITCYFEEKSIDEFYTQLASAMKSLDRSYEIVFVNDGSTDGTFQKLESIYSKDPSVYAIIDLFRNSGQTAAQTAAFEHLRGECLVVMDSDLQLDPSEIKYLMNKYDDGYDIVSGCRRNRKDALMRIIPSRIANIIMRKISRSNLKDFGCTFKAMRMALIRGGGYGPFKPWLAVDVIA